MRPFDILSCLVNVGGCHILWPHVHYTSKEDCWLGIPNSPCPDPDEENFGPGNRITVICLTKRVVKVAEEGHFWDRIYTIDVVSRLLWNMYTYAF